MNESQQYEMVCKSEFSEVHAKLDRLDESIRGNGRPGIHVRLDRLEAAERTRGRLLWLVVGVVITLGATAVWQKVMGG
jgi:hypothetical protein